MGVKEEKNNKQVKISIIIPNYNNEKFLLRCINSILKSKSNKLEIVIIDDGSTDNSIDTLEKIEDNRLVLFKQSNQGVSVARNKGIDIAKGEYILFCDADDYYVEDGIDFLLENIVQDNKVTDLFLFTAIKKINEKEKLWVDFKKDGMLKDESIEKVLFHLFMQGKYSSLWNKLYKANIIKDHGIIFPIGLKTGEDNIFNIQYALKCEKLKILERKKGIYAYCYKESPYASSKLYDTDLLLKQLKYKIMLKEELLLCYYEKFEGILKNKEIYQRQMKANNIVLLYQYGKKNIKVKKYEYFKVLHDDQMFTCIINTSICKPTSIKNFLRALLIKKEIILYQFDSYKREKY